MKPPKIIYLQTDKESELFYDEGVTWCVDKINDTDETYLLSTPAREAAYDLLKTLQHAASYFQMLEAASGVKHPMLREIESVISLATETK